MKFKAGFLKLSFETLLALFKPRVRSSGSLVGRLIRLASMWFIFALAITGLGLTTLFQEAALRRFQISVAQISENLYADTDLADNGDLIPPEFFDTRVNRVHSGLYWQINEVFGDRAPIIRNRSRSLWDKQILIPEKTLAEAKAKTGESVFFNAIGPAGEHMRGTVIFSAIDGRDFVFLAAEDRSQMDREVTRFGLITLAALFVMALGSLVAIFGQVRVGLKPLFELTDEISDIRLGKIAKLEKVYPQEIKPVANQINALIDHAQETVERQRTHVGNLAHALKTPLSVLLASAADKEDELSQSVRKQVDQMRSQVDHHLRRARAAARSQSFGAKTEIEPVIDELAVMLEQIFRDKGVIIDWRCPETLVFRGEKQDFLEIAGNLLENACIWCRKKVRVDVKDDAAENTLYLVIEDDGPGLDQSRFSEVLKRGARLDESVPGTGLGLSIVDELVRAYGGNMSLDKSSMGGLKVKVRLPLLLSKI